MKKRDAGFTLIEVLLSLTILAILLIPLLSSFVTATKVNTKAKRTQKATVLAQNIMESLKATDIQDIALQFNNGKTFQLIRSNLSGSAGNKYLLHTYENQGYGEYYQYSDNLYKRITATTNPISSVLVNQSDLGVKQYTFKPPEDRSTFIFAIEHIMDEKSGYDALITLDASVYQDNTKYPNTMNNYRMPNLIELNDKEVAILDLEGKNITWSDDTINAVPIHQVSMDEQAVSEFYNMYLSYLSYKASKDEDITNPTLEPTPTPIPLTMEQIKNTISKSIVINIAKNESSNLVNVACSVHYHTSFDFNEDGVTDSLPAYEVSSSNYELSAGEIESYVYVFYTPSSFLFDDTIQISNDGVKANLYIANQKKNATSKVTIHKEESNLGATYVYTNLSGGQLVSSFPIYEYTLIEKKKPIDRLYDITVAIYKDGSIASQDLSNPEIVLTSTLEDENEE